MTTPIKRSMTLASVCVAGLLACCTGLYAQRNAGIFYSTLFAKTKPYNRISGLGKQAAGFFLKDINGDGKDDALAYYSTGDWYGALSNGAAFVNPRKYLVYTSGTATPIGSYHALMGDVNGDGKTDAVYFDPGFGGWHVALANDTGFLAPVLWSNGNGVGAAGQLLADVNGDGKEDAIIYFQSGGLAGSWYVGLSTGTGFGSFSSWTGSFGATADQCMAADVNGDGKADAVCFKKSDGSWQVALSGGSSFAAGSTWKTGFGTGKEKGFVYDVDRDGKADIVYYDSGEWWVSYSSGSGFGAYHHRWVAGNRPAVPKGNIPAPDATLLGDMSDTATVACAVSLGNWLCLDNNNKGATADAVQTDTWYAWGNDYQPQVPGHPGTYDSGDSTINDIQLRMIHDAGFTYIMFDITNGPNAWVDNRALQFAARIVRWNSQLQPGQHKMYFCVAMGGSGGLTGAAAATVVESESKRAWDNFYIPYQDCYYKQDGKPLLIHFVWWPANSDDIKGYAAANPGAMTYFGQCTVRWMYNEIKNDTAYKNAYGWPILNKFGNPVGNEVMDVMPGFWNGAFGTGREQGELYRSQWLRVLQYTPQSVWLNSFNETWEHTSVEPAWIPPDSTIDNPSLISAWTDYYGTRMDDFYWVMTKQYTRLYMYGQLFENSYIQEYGNPDVYKVTAAGTFQYQGAMPHLAPVLLVPAGFRSAFAGSIINDSLQTVSLLFNSSAMKQTVAGTAVIYPNPVTNGQLFIRYNGRPGAEAVLYNQLGIATIRKKLYGQVTELNMQQLPPGSYYLCLYERNRRHTYKVLVAASPDGRASY
ncbi:FG-GAP-like repeat-containing protein [Chitinophaga sp. 212800010-3]|uniref:FG-GAP-like repeat-containing protein n=1 Tax=unclassified Chitinophaga TaxID=2619133 RepID=UPI002E10E744